METKTWPAIVGDTVLSYQQKLINRAHRVLNDGDDKNRTLDIAIAGITCVITKEQAATMLLREISKEQEELVAVNTKYNRLGLEREAIIKTSFFRKIVRKVDLMKDLYFFSSFDTVGSVWSNLEQYNNSIVQTKLLQLLEEVSESEEVTDVVIKNLEIKMRSIVDMAKDILWERHSDSIGGTGKRRIKIEILDPPVRTRDRLIEWKMEGFNPSLVCHRDSFIPHFLKSTIDNIKEVLCEKMAACTKTESRESVALILSMLKPNDPIVYIEDGDWTVIIDQYADFPQEQQILFQVKDHYSRLGKQFGVINNN